MTNKPLIEENKMRLVGGSDVKVEEASTSFSDGKENGSGHNNKHMRTGSMSQLDTLMSSMEETNAGVREPSSISTMDVATTPERKYSLDDHDEQIEYSPRPSPRPQSAKPKGMKERAALQRRKVSLERYSTSILDKETQATSMLESKLKPIAASTRECEPEDREAESQNAFENYVVSEFGIVKPISEHEGILDLDERERVYNTLIYVPVQYERMVSFGLLLCLDSFLALFTLMPVRIIYSVYHSICKLRKKEPLRIIPFLRKLANRNEKSKANTSPTLKEDEESFEQTLPDYLCDFLWLGLILLSCSVLLQMKTSEAFHYIHAQEVIKLYVVLTMLEIFDKICGSLSFYCLENLAASCSMVLGGRSSRGGQQYPLSKGGRADTFRVSVDFFVTLLVMCIHCLIIMLEAVAFNVVLNSASSSLLALLVSNNFAELKGTVFKNMNVTRLWTLSIQDIVEHFHISVCLVFVLIENMLLTNAYLPSYQMTKQCAMILITEIVVDIMKHAFVGKFQNLKPGVYSEYLKDMCEKTVASSSINGYKIVKFNPLVPAAILLRIFWPLLARSWSNADTVLSKFSFLLSMLVVWVCLFGFKVVIGWSLQLIAKNYLEYYSTTRKLKGKPWLLSSRKTVDKTQ